MIKIENSVVEIPNTNVSKLLNEENYDVVILLSHLDFKWSEITYNYFADNLNGIDVIINGFQLWYDSQLDTTLHQGRIQLGKDGNLKLGRLVTSSILKNFAKDADAVIDWRTLI